MKLPVALIFGAILLCASACEKDEPDKYPVTMRFEKVVPTSNYYYYIGGERIDDPAAMAHFRNKGIVQHYTGYHETEYWSEPDCAEFDRIDFPDKTHCRMLWARGGVKMRSTCPAKTE